MSLQEDLFFRYKEMYRPYINRLNAVLAEYQLYSSQWLILDLVRTEGPLALVDIAERRGVEKPTVTRMVKRLAELGLVGFAAGKDKREKMAAVTEKGETLCVEIRLKIEEMQNMALAGISEEEQREAGRVLAQIRKNLLQ